MPETHDSSQETSMFSVPTVGSVVKGVAIVTVVGLCISAGLAAYRVSSYFESAPEDDSEDA